MKRRIVVGVVILCCLLCFACSHKKESTQIPDYLDIMSGTESGDQNTSDTPSVSDKTENTDDNSDNSKPAPDDDETPKPPVDDSENQRPIPPTLSGFRSIGTVYDRAIDFFGKHTLAVYNGKTILLDDQGAEAAWEKDVDYEFRQDRYIVTEGKNKKLMDLEGNVIVEGEFSDIQYDGSTIVASDETYTYIFRDSERIGSPTVRRFQIIRDGWLQEVFDEDSEEQPACAYNYNLELQPYTIENCIVQSPAVRDMTLLYDEDSGMFGYAKGDTVVIEPKFVMANDFSDGYACVIQLNNNFQLENCLIDETGSYITQTTLALTLVYDGYYFTYHNEENGPVTYTLHDFTDKVFDLPDGLIPYNDRVYNGYIIDEERNRVYSLDKKDYLPLTYAEITPTDDGLFIAKDTNGKYSLRTSEFETLIDNQEEISYAYGIYRFVCEEGTCFQEYIGV